MYTEKEVVLKCPECGNEDQFYTITEKYTVYDRFGNYLHTHESYEYDEKDIFCYSSGYHSRVEDFDVSDEQTDEGD